MCTNALKRFFCEVAFVTKAWRRGMRGGVIHIIAVILLLECYICDHMSICNEHIAMRLYNQANNVDKNINNNKLCNEINLGIPTNCKCQQYFHQPPNSLATICHFDLCNENNLRFWNPPKRQPYQLVEKLEKFGVFQMQHWFVIEIAYLNYGKISVPG